MALALIQMINTALSLWNSKEKTKYFDQNRTLEEAYHEAINKPNAPDADTFYSNPDAYRDNGAVDGIEFQLRNLSFALSAAIAAKDP